jgi:CRISPR-associated protein Cas2
MPGSKEWWLIAYDVRDPKRLRRVAKHLEGFGTRMQYSLFRARLTRREAERLRWELIEITEKEDDLLLLPLTQSCLDRLWQRNNADEWTTDQEPCFIV